MQPDRDPAWIWDALEAARAIVRFTEGMTLKEYRGDEIRRLAVERQLTVIGEAARRLSPSFRETYPEVPWRKIIGLRNVLTHEYGTIDHDRIWTVVTTEIPTVIAILAKALPPNPPDPEPE